MISVANPLRLIGYAFAATGLAVTTYLRDFSDFQLIQLVMQPMYLIAFGSLALWIATRRMARMLLE
ncbi:MAG TPA: hypothetical protein VFD90_03045 [Gaiellales bacterium]|nr:hypothetical protein [Gaiellales bacterium]